MTRTMRIAAAALIAAGAALPAMAEGPQERALDQSLQQMDGQAYAPPPAIAPAPRYVAPTSQYIAPGDPAPQAILDTPASVQSQPLQPLSGTEGPQERALDRSFSDVQAPAGTDPEVRRLNGGQ